MLQEKCGFTLAEVLITLAVIGVVAALTVPNIVKNYQKTQTVTQLKKVYSALSNTTNLAISGYGPVTEWDVGEHFSGQSSVDFANKYLIPYLKVSKNCETKTSGDCAFNFTYLHSGTQRFFNNTYARFYLNDGTLIATTLENNIREDGLSYKQAHILIDINGQKKPNKFGKDLFFFKYYIFQGTQSNASNGKFIPYSYNTPRSVLIGTTGNADACYKDGNGTLCTALILQDGWKIADDYPW